MVQKEPQKKPRVILIDDDPSYRTIMVHCAGMLGIECDAFESPSDLGSLGLLAHYDAAIVDYDLGFGCGVEMAFEMFRFTEIPMILVSAKDREPDGKGWPLSIKMFVKKSKGYSFALEQAKRYAERRRS